MAWTTAEAAAAVGTTPGSFRGTATRARAKGVELRTARDTWPDQRTPLYDETAVRNYFADRTPHTASAP